MTEEQGKRLKEIRKDLAEEKQETEPVLGYEFFHYSDEAFLMVIIDEQQNEIKLLEDALESASEFSDAR